MRVSQIGQQPFRFTVLERKVGNSIVPVEAEGDPRNETAEKTVGVVEQ